MLTIGVAVLIGISTIAGWWWYHHAHRAKEVMGAGASQPKHSPPNDPRLTFATPFLNVRPEVVYVGDENMRGELSSEYFIHAAEGNPTAS
jgi:hypothetical protein